MLLAVALIMRTIYTKLNISAGSMYFIHEILPNSRRNACAITSSENCFKITFSFQARLPICDIV